MQKAVKIKNRTWDIAANIHLPKDFDQTKKYAAVVCVHPSGSVKEQTASLYASKLAEEGFVSIVFDASFIGESGGEPRYTEDPAMRVEDIRCTVDYLTTLDYVDEERIGLLGICAGGGYATNAVLSEKRIKALGVVSVINIGRAYREGNFIQMLEATGKQRTAEANGAELKITNWTLGSPEDVKKAGVTETDAVEVVDYYRTPRGEHPRANNKRRFTTDELLITFDAFRLAEHLLTQPLYIVVGDRVGSFGSYRDGFDLLSKAASKNKSIHVVHGASHYDLYDQPGPTGEALSKLIPFFKENL